jgi:uncharacterized protein YbbC (DUF1343 family)
MATIVPIDPSNGRTVSELAGMIEGGAVLPWLDNLGLTVVEMKPWSRSMQWPDTQREWTPPSPNLPTWQTALVYPGMCFFEGVRVNEGRGSDHPFLQIGLPWSQSAAQSVVDTLQARSLPGVTVDTTTFTPTSRPQAAPSPRFEDQKLSGFRIRVTERRAVEPVELGIHALHAAHQQAQVEGDTAFVSRADHLTRLAGTDQLLDLLRDGASPQAITEKWQSEVQAFRKRRAPYLLY